jgi:hypothetical protein
MKRLLTMLVGSGMLLMGAQAFAAEPMASGSKNNTASHDMTPDQMAKRDQAMKDCMAKQKSMSATMSQDDMTTACKTEMKAKHDAMMKEGTAK